MKSVFKFIAIGIVVLSLGAEVFAQGNINVINSGTNLAVIAAADSADSAIIAQQYIGGKITFPATGGATAISSNNGVVVYGMSNIVVYGYTVTSYGTTNVPNVLIPHTSGSRVAVFLTNLMPPSQSGAGYPVTNNDYGVKLGAYAVGAAPDYVIKGGESKELYFEGGYNGEISARWLGTNSYVSVTNGLLYSEIGNSPGQP